MRQYRALLFLSLFAFTMKAQTFVNGQAARAVIGQNEFTAAVSNAQQYITGGVSGLAYANGMLFVADSNGVGATPENNRVLVFNTSQINAPHADLTNISWPDPSCRVCGYSAENVLGQADYVSTNPGVADAPYQSSGQAAGWMYEPTGVASDGHILAVADTNNNRVLLWNSIPTAMDQPASLVLGQPTFTAATTPEPPNASSISGPEGVWIQNGKLFVADTGNNRVLIWNSIPTSNNQPADLVLGQSNLNTGTQNVCLPTNATITPTASELCNPVSVTSDGTHLFVTDLGFNRVLIWNSIPTAKGQNADVVVGQLQMTTAVPNNTYAVCPSNGTNSNGDTYPTQCGATLDTPQFALSDGTRLFIADGGNDRVLIFNSIPTANGATADEVLGQPDFVSNVDTSQTITITSTAIDNTAAVDVIPSPMSLAFDGTNLYVSDAYNRRVLVFTPGDSVLPSNSVLNWASEIIRQEGVVTMLVTTIASGDTVTITIQGTAYTYTIKSTDTGDTIAQGLVSAINANSGDPNVTAIFAGVGTGSVYLSSKATNLAFDAISLAATTSNTTDLTATASGAYLSAGTGATAAPGMLVEVDGTNLSDANSPVVAALSGTLPTSLGGVEVYMDGFASPLLSASASQVVAQVPYPFADGRNSVSVYVRTVHTDGSVTATNATPAYIAPANPGLFNAPAYANQPRPWPATGALHQSGNPTAVVSIDGTANAGDQATISINSRIYTYTEKSGDTLASVVQGLVILINNAPDPQVTAQPGGAFTRVVLTAIQGGQAGTGIPISGSTSTSAQVTVTPYTSSTCCAVTPGTRITPSNPAAPGELITMNATGLGTLVDDQGNALASPTTGTPYEGTQPNSASNSVSATINGQTAEVIGAGLPQGAYGVYQVQLIIPSGFATTAAAQVYIAQNAYISNIVTIPVGAAVMVTPPPIPPVNPFKISIDTPNSLSAPLSGVTHIGGWAIDSNAVINSVSILVDGRLFGTVSETGNRPDVCSVFPSPGCPYVGWNYLLDTTPIANGSHTLEVTAYGADGLHFTAGTSITVANVTSNFPTHVFIDQPASQDVAYQGVVTFSGWAVNNTSPISSVLVSVDGVSLRSVQDTGSRLDVCAKYPGPSCPNVGWSVLVDTSTLTDGTHNLEVTGIAANGQEATATNSFTVANWTTADPITINVDTPNSQSGAFAGVAAIGGWAVDTDAAIETIQVSVDGVAYGNAAYGGNRPDVCIVFPGRAGCPNVGWNFAIDTTLLADGAHTLAITATPAAGQRSTATTTFTVANFAGSNPMRVDIDTPNPQSAALSGSAPIGGWAISSNAMVASVQIYVDGVLKGTGIPGARPDVCAAFPQAQGCPNVGWNFLLDTTFIANGSHILEVTATSATGEHGTASMSFTVSNSPPSNPTKLFIDQPGPNSTPFLGLALLSGWAVNDNATIATVTVSVDGAPVGTANYGINSAVGPRADVCAVYPGRPGCPYVGWSFLLDTTQFADGAHSLGVVATASNGAHYGVSSPFIVANWSTPDPVTINIDSPNSESTPFFGTAQFGGWVVDNNGPIASVSISVDGIPFGTAAYGGARADVCAVYTGAVGCPNVGWNTLVDTTLLPDGNHTLGVTATSIGGQSSTATASFTVAN